MKPLIVLLGPTASGKTALALALAQHFSTPTRPVEILSCDSVAVYRHMELGTAKPTPAQRALVPHHCLDLYDPSQPCTAGDYARHARATLAHLATRNCIPILAGGTGLYARALLDGLFPAPPANPALRTLLRTRAAARGPAHLHRTLARFDPHAATLIHPHDLPKLIRAIEVSVAARRPITKQWTEGRDALTGYAILRLTLAPNREAPPREPQNRVPHSSQPHRDEWAPIDIETLSTRRNRVPHSSQPHRDEWAPIDIETFSTRRNRVPHSSQPHRDEWAPATAFNGEALYPRINQRAAQMFTAGLLQETEALIARFGPHCRPFQSLGYAQAAAVLAGTLTEPQAIALTAQGHRNYSKRQMTWFRREAQLHPTHWLHGPGDSPAIQSQAIALLEAHLKESSS